MRLWRGTRPAAVAAATATAVVVAGLAWETRSEFFAAATRQPPPPPTSDPFDLERRFVRTHRTHFDGAMRELAAGRKRGHWSWYVFPTPPYVDGRGREAGSGHNREYALRDPPPHELQGVLAAQAFLQFPPSGPDGVDLRANYLAMLRTVQRQLDRGVSAEELVGWIDEPKLRSSVRLFLDASAPRKSPPAPWGGDAEVHAACARLLRAMK